MKIRQSVPPKRLSNSAGLRFVTSQKILLFVVTLLRTSKRTKKITLGGK
jgi:hypothetical protein